MVAVQTVFIESLPYILKSSKETHRSQSFVQPGALLEVNSITNVPGIFRSEWKG